MSKRAAAGVAVRRDRASAAEIPDDVDAVTR
jgi:hypothetical protein